jgi:hypothetical protein
MVFNGKMWRENTSKLANRNDSLHKTNDDNGMSVVNFAT